MDKLREDVAVYVRDSFLSLMFSAEHIELMRELGTIRAANCMLTGVYDFTFQGKNYWERRSKPLHFSLTTQMAKYLRHEKELDFKKAPFKSYLTEALHAFPHIDDVKQVLPSHTWAYLEGMDEYLRGARQPPEKLQAFLALHERDFHKFNMRRAERLLFS